MDNRRSSGLWPAQPAPNDPNGLASVPPKSSYRRSAEGPPGGYTGRGGPPPASYSSNRPPAQNGVSRTPSHRRRESMPQAPPTMPAAPEVPRAPPVSYRGPYGGTAIPARSRSNAKQYPPLDTRSRPPQQSSAHNAPISPISPVEPTKRDSSRRDSTRRESTTDRSPLQKLEKRARLQEAELQAQERATTRGASNRGSRHVSDPQRPISGSAPTSSERRNVSGPTGSQERWSNIRNSVDAKESQGARPTSYEDKSGIPERRRSTYRKEREVEAASRDPVNTRGASQNDKDRYYSMRRSGTDPASFGAERNRQAPATGGVGRSPSRKLQKEPKWEYAKPVNKDKSLPDIPKEPPKSPYMSQPEPASKPESTSSPVYTFTKRGSFAAPGKSYKVPSALANYSQASERTPQTATRDIPREPSREPARSSSQKYTRESGAHPEEHTRHTHVTQILHRHHDPERRYAPSRPLDEWKSAGTASLVGEDLFLEGPLPNKSSVPVSADKSTPWWEQSPSQRRQSSSYASSPPTKGAVDPGPEYHEPTGETLFSPRLFLKCGPLLRYTGLAKERTSSNRERELWKGSVMIVTEDSYSSYETTPTLALFSQPMDLLPPPPAQLDAASGNLAPEYVDPLRGQRHLSRTGKTLYVRPVEDMAVEADMSRIEDDNGLFEEIKTVPTTPIMSKGGKIPKRDGERLGKVRYVKGVRLHAERGVTFWRFNLQVELGSQQARIAYRINHGPAIGFWVPARGETMNIMFHSCNGFSLSVDSRQFCGPDPMWRDVLNNHQTRPFHVMIGGGDQIYNDAAMRDTELFGAWSAERNPQHKHHAEFSTEMQDELEQFYLDRYSMWFSQGLFGMANSQIPMVNVWDDHDIIDGYGSYPDHFMKTPVFTGIGAIAFKYYMLFQHQSVAGETEKDEPSWLLGYRPGPYIKERSRSVFMSLGKKVAFLGLDCRTERMRDEILTQETYDNVFDRLNDEIKKGETKHLIVLLGVPIAYPRLNFLENVLTSRLMDPIKALGRTGMLGGFVNKFDGGVEILDDLDDHWTAKHHKRERNWFIQELQYLAAAKSVRVTILGGDVHLAAIGQFFTPAKHGVPKDRDHRYMPNIVSSAIVNTPPPEMMADVINKRNKIHHLDRDTDENMIPIFTHDVDGKPRNNKHLLPRRNWCALREYAPGSTPPSSRDTSPSPSRDRSPSPEDEPRPGRLTRTLSLGRKDFQPGNIIRRLSRSRSRPARPMEDDDDDDEPSISRRPMRRDTGPPMAYYNSQRSMTMPTSSHRRSISSGGAPQPPHDPPRPNPFHRRPTGLSEKAASRGGAMQDDEDELHVAEGQIDLLYGLDVVLNVEVSPKDPAGITTPYRLLIPALRFVGPMPAPPNDEYTPSQSRDDHTSVATDRRASAPATSRGRLVRGGGAGGLLGSIRRSLSRRRPARRQDDYTDTHGPSEGGFVDDGASDESFETGPPPAANTSARRESTAPAMRPTTDPSHIARSKPGEVERVPATSKVAAPVGRARGVDPPTREVDRAYAGGGRYQDDDLSDDSYDSLEEEDAWRKKRRGPWKILGGAG